jgi:hypothetical protein
MAYNSLTERQKRAFRLTARQAIPRNDLLQKQRNLEVVRHAPRPSNDSNLRFESRAEEVVVEGLMRIAEAIEDAPPPAITSPLDGSVQTDPLYIISGTAFPFSEVTLHNDDNPDVAMATVRTADDGTFTFAGDTPVVEGDTEWWVVAAGKESAHITVTLDIPDDEPEQAELPLDVSFKTHAESDQYLIDHNLTEPEGWDTMTLTQKAAAINGH